MRKSVLVALVLLSAAVASLNSCKDEENAGCGATNISSAGGSSSHNAGHNCMTCHTDGGEGTGCFNVAGTVYDPTKSNIYPNATVKLFTLPGGGGQLVATIYGDSRGNFFTTAGVDFGTGLYPMVYGTAGEISEMSTAITSGACNACHGSTVEKIYLNP
jgi:hypothetical protein